MSHFVSKSFFDPGEADDAVNALLAARYSRDDINVVMSDRGRRRYKANDSAAVGTIGTLIAGRIPVRAVSGASLVIAGPLAEAFDAAGSLLAVMMDAGIARKEAERLGREVSRGNILVAVRSRGEDLDRLKAF